MRAQAPLPLSLKVTGWVCAVMGVLAALGIVVFCWGLLTLAAWGRSHPSGEALGVAPDNFLRALMVDLAVVSFATAGMFAVFGFAMARAREWGRQGLLLCLCVAGVLAVLSLLTSSVVVSVACLALLYFAFRWINQPLFREACGPERTDEGQLLV